VIPAGWRQEGHPATKTLLQFRFNLIWLSTKMGGVQPVVPCGQPNLPTRNRNKWRTRIKGATGYPRFTWKNDR